MGQRESAVFVGEASLLVQVATRWIEAGHAVVAIMSNDAAVRGFAETRGVPLLAAGDYPGLHALHDTTPFTTLFSVANLSMLPASVLALPSRYAINFHDGPLPRYSGLNATSWAIARGERTHGVTWHEMTASADAGRILAQQSLEIAPDETALSLNAKCWTAGIASFETLLAALTADTLVPQEQDPAQRTYFGRRDRPSSACMIDLTGPAAEVEALIRALDFGIYANPIGRARLLTTDGIVLVGAASIVRDGTSGYGDPGLVLAADSDSITVAACDGVVQLSQLIAVGGGRWTPPAPGQHLPLLTETDRHELAELSRAVAGDKPYFLAQFSQWTATEFSSLALASESAVPTLSEREASSEVPAPLAALGSDAVIGAVLAFLARSAPVPEVHVWFSEPRLRDLVGAHRALFADVVPLVVQIDETQPLQSAIDHVSGLLHVVRGRSTWARDLPWRFPSLAALPRPLDAGQTGIAVIVAENVDAAPAYPGAALTVLVSADGRRVVGRVSGGTSPAETADRWQRQLAVFLSRAWAAERVPLGRIALWLPEDALLTAQFNATAREFTAQGLQSQFERCAAQAPDRVALLFREERVTYRELDERANGLAHLLRSHGVGRDTLVGIFTERSPEMVIAALAIWKAGGAYVPLDPTYPPDRVAFMVADAKLPVVLTQTRIAHALPRTSAVVLAIDADSDIGSAATGPASDATPDDLAYVIYTSGSTGTPKGVMVEHRNVENFFVGMDERLGHTGEPGIWLAVTSLSFDISVLELFWTLTRGFTVVLYREPSRQLSVPPAARPVELSLFYFASDEGERASGKYQLLLDGARFADTHGFAAVWTPERHFHAFGGLFPNPAVISAALASVTSRVALRAGSCVSPLHSPIRIAEDWSIVDNLSGGRVGISFAAGWQPNDFVIRPEAFADRKQQMFRDIDTVRRLWRGERVGFPDAEGRNVDVAILPRPVQRELPVWVTAAGNPETFEEAGRIGANLLTHLLGQSFAELKEKVVRYRRARAAANHEGPGVVTVMLHTYVSNDAAEAKETVREPMKRYLNSSLALIKEAAWSFPTFKQGTTLPDGSFGIEHLRADELDALLNHSFERYYRSSGLFGNLDEAKAVVDQVRACDIDEIACLIDFGVASDAVMANLPNLAAVQAYASRSDTSRGSAIRGSAIRGSAISGSATHGSTTRGTESDPDVSPDVPLDVPLDVLLRRHGATHLQCTPTLASMLVRDDGARAALQSLRVMLVGGEALPVALAQELRTVVGGRLLNMYGPTETTIWSSTWDVPHGLASVSIGQPIANTDLLILDRAMQPMPIGQLGELGIGGAGIARGYLHRPELTAERFIPHPLRPTDRLYRTGDLARLRADGVLEFHGRLDQQVKIRGHRIELGEIEARLLQHVAVQQAIVVAHDVAPGGMRLAAYLIGATAGDMSAAPESAVLKSFLLDVLPEVMVPSDFVWLPRWPLTPNGKIDRKALRIPDRASISVSTSATAPTNDLEQAIVVLWRELLARPSVGIDDNFFDSGGHSLLSVELLVRLKTLTSAPLMLVDLFRFPTVRQLAQFLQRGADPSTLGQETTARTESRHEGAQRRAALLNRRRGAS